MRYLVRLLPPGKPSSGLLELVRGIARSLEVEVRNPKWSSYGGLELDVFVQSPPDFELFLSAVEPLAKLEFLKDLNRAPPTMTKQESLEEARALFNAERYWECHEVLEGVWRNSEGSEKLLVQGLILVCAAYVHQQKGEIDVGLGILQRAAPQITWESGVYFGVDIAGLAGSVAKVLRSRKFTIFQI